MSKTDWLGRRAITSVAITIVLFASARGQSIQFPGDQAPVIATPSVKQVSSSGRASMVVNTTSGREFVPSYDASGRLTSLKSTTGRNAFDLRAVSYFPDGRMWIVSFGNRYELIFRYHNDGTQEIVDSLGGSVVRSQISPGQFIAQSARDPTGFLVPSLRRIEALFSLFGHVPGLAASTPGVVQ